MNDPQSVSTGGPEQPVTGGGQLEELDPSTLDAVAGGAAQIWTILRSN